MDGSGRIVVGAVKAVRNVLHLDDDDDRQRSRSHSRSPAIAI